MICPGCGAQLDYDETTGTYSCADCGFTCKFANIKKDNDNLNSNIKIEQHCDTLNVIADNSIEINGNLSEAENNHIESPSDVLNSMVESEEVADLADNTDISKVNNNETTPLSLSDTYSEQRDETPQQKQSGTKNNSTNTLSHLKSLTPFQLVFRFFPACMLILYSLLILGFLGGNVALAGTGYDYIALGDILGGNLYGASAYILSMAIILLIAGIAQIILALLLEKDLRFIKYLYFAIQMCIYATMFVTACVLIDEANTIAADIEYGLGAGGCAVAIFLFTIIWMIATPFTYVASISQNEVEAKEIITAFFSKTAYKTKQLIAKIKTKLDERAKQKAEEQLRAEEESKAEIISKQQHIPQAVPVFMPEQSALQAKPVIISEQSTLPTQDIISETSASIDQQANDVIISTSAANDDSDVITSYAFESNDDIILESYSTDDYLDDFSIPTAKKHNTKITGRYAAFRIISVLIIMLTSIVSTVYYSSMPSFFTGWIATSIILAFMITSLVLTSISAKKNANRVAVSVIWSLGYCAFAISCILNLIMFFDTSSRKLLFSCLMLCMLLFACISAPVMFGIGMGKPSDYGKKLTKGQRTSHKVGSIITSLLCILMLLLPTIAVVNYQSISDYVYQNINIGMTRSEVMYKMQDSYNSSSNYYLTYWENGSSVDISFDNQGYVDSISVDTWDSNSNNISETVYPVNYPANDGSQLYVVKESFQSYGWQKNLYNSTINDMIFDSETDKMTIYYEISYGSYHSTYTVDEWINDYGFTEIMDYFTNNFDDSNIYEDDFFVIKNNSPNPFQINTTYLDQLDQSLKDEFLANAGIESYQYCYILFAPNNSNSSSTITFTASSTMNVYVGLLIFGNQTNNSRLTMSINDNLICNIYGSTNINSKEERTTIYSEDIVSFTYSIGDTTNSGYSYVIIMVL